MNEMNYLKMDTLESRGQQGVDINKPANFNAEL
jgi:hypothetical protein